MAKPLITPNPLTKHLYQHEHNKQHECNKCKKVFPFVSQLNTHKLTHRNKPNQVCVYPKCGRRFKSKSDLNRHAASHTKAWLTCTDCPNYKTKDKRNFESHRLTHSKINKYFCEKCGKGFTFNTQKRRHTAKDICNKYFIKISVSLCLETYSMLRVEILVDTTCGNTQIAITQYRRSNKPSVLRVEILFDATCGNIDRNPFIVLLQMKERVLYVETVTVK